MNRSTPANHRISGAVMIALLAAGALATGSVGRAPAANASCASFFGIGNSADCTSNATTIAIAIGNGAQAQAFGLFTSAVAVGANAHALNYADGGQGFSFASAIGDQSQAFTFGNLGLAVAVGGGTSYAGTLNSPIANFGNVAVSFGNSTTSSVTGGLANIAFNAGNGNSVTAFGTFNAGVNLFGNGNGVFAENPIYSTPTRASLALNVLGSQNNVQAGPGPVAIAVSILQTHGDVTKAGSGFNINGHTAGGAASVTKTSATARGAAAASGTHVTRAPAKSAARTKKPTKIA